jgi:hypothetical protein
MLIFFLKLRDGALQALYFGLGDHIVVAMAVRILLIVVFKGGL